MSALKTPVDYKSLEEELHAALAADQLYRLQNDAKIRAVEQGVPTYEDFRQMVNAAHLKPLDRDDTKPTTGVQWNPMINTVTSRDSISADISEKPKVNTKKDENIAKKSPKTCEEFVRLWASIADYSESFTYVWNLRDSLQTQLFRAEIPASVLSNFLDVCLQYSSNTDDVSPIVELLAILNTCNRFDLTMCFMTNSERSTCERLFRRLRIKANSQNESLKRTVVSLAAKYQIQLE